MASAKHDWYVGEWLKTLGMRQAELCRRTDLPKSTVSELVNGVQPYSREKVNQISAALQIQPWELLMHPEDAMRIRRLRQAAAEIVAESGGTSEEATLRRAS